MPGDPVPVTPLFLGDRGASLYDLYARRGRTLVINGTADDVVSIPKMGPPFFDDLRKRAITLHGSDKNVFDVRWIDSGGHRPYFLTKPAYVWLNERLHFPSFAPNIGETHISDWAGANHVEIDKLYATELREGGTQAIGRNVPAVPHDDMNALPADRWSREKDKYVYESWLQAAKERVK